MPERAEWEQSFRQRAELAAIAGVGYPAIRALGATYKWKVSGAEHDQAVYAAGRRPILAFWHGRILPATLYFQRRGIVVITSANYDGEWIARIIGKFGYGTARGSTSRGGPRALRQLVRDVRATGAAFTLDGPRGPARVAQPGAVWLSKTTGHPLLPFHFEARPNWTLNSWDEAQIPRPFATIAMAIHKPLYVPRNADDAELEQWRLRLEQSIEQCQAKCLELLGHPGQAPSPKSQAPSL